MASIRFGQCCCLKARRLLLVNQSSSNGKRLDHISFKNTWFGQRLYRKEKCSYKNAAEETVYLRRVRLKTNFREKIACTKVASGKNSKVAFELTAANYVKI